MQLKSMINWGKILTLQSFSSANSIMISTRIQMSLPNSQIILSQLIISIIVRRIRASMQTKSIILRSRQKPLVSK